MNTRFSAFRIVSSFITLFILSLPVGASAADEKEAMSLLKKSKCLTCHSPDKTKDGPSYKKVAEKYRGDSNAMPKLFKHLTVPSMVEIDGDKEEHGIVKTRDEEKINNLLEWILSV